MGTESKWSELKDRATLLETRIAHEINLMGQRMTWLVTSQSFLFAAWVQFARARDPDAKNALSDATAMLVYVVPAVGLGVSLAGWLAIAAAMRMVDMLVVARAGVDTDLGLPRMSPLRDHAWTRLFGHVPTELLPPLFLVAWSAVAVREISRGSSWSNEDIMSVAAPLLGGWLLLRIVVVYRSHRYSKLLAACADPQRTVLVGAPADGSSPARDAHDGATKPSTAHRRGERTAFIYERGRENGPHLFRAPITRKQREQLLAAGARTAAQVRALASRQTSDVLGQ